MAFPFDLLVRSLCPSIIGHDCVKAGILLGLLGGTPSSSGLEDVKSGLTIRSNIHCLIVGDPGMGRAHLFLPFCVHINVLLQKLIFDYFSTVL